MAHNSSERRPNVRPEPESNSEPSSEQQLRVALLYPDNQRAKAIWPFQEGDVATTTTSTLNTHHHRFLFIDGEDKMCYSLSLDVPPDGPRGSWRLGKGSSAAPGRDRGVDLLLCRVPEPSMGRFHALLSFHHKSGALMLQSINTIPITYLSGDGNADIHLSAGDKVVMHMTMNRLRFGSLDYCLKFTEAGDRREFKSHLESYNYIVAKADAGSAATLHLVDSVPKQSHLRIRNIIQHRTIGHGSFGVVKSGVDMFTGDPLAIKTLNYQRRSATAIKQELEIASLFSSDCVGIVPMLDSWCEHGESPPC